MRATCSISREYAYGRSALFGNDVNAPVFAPFEPELHQPILDRLYSSADANQQQQQQQQTTEKKGNDSPLMPPRNSFVDAHEFTMLRSDY